MSKDLVCGRDVPEDTRFFTEYNNHQYLFCSAACKRRFDDHPDYFIQEQAKQDLHL